MNPLPRYQEVINQIQAEIDELQAQLDRHRNIAPESVNWGTVGDLQNLLRQLRQVNGKEWKD